LSSGRPFLSHLARAHSRLFFPAVRCGWSCESNCVPGSTGNFSLAPASSARVIERFARPHPSHTVPPILAASVAFSSLEARLVQYSILDLTLHICISHLVRFLLREHAVAMQPKSSARQVQIHGKATRFPDCQSSRASEKSRAIYSNIRDSFGHAFSGQTPYLSGTSSQHSMPEVV
jgi:hypothetical protein